MKNALKNLFKQHCSSATLPSLSIFILPVCLTKFRAVFHGAVG